MANAQWPTKSQAEMTNAEINLGPWDLVLTEEGVIHHWPIGHFSVAGPSRLPGGRDA